MPGPLVIFLHSDGYDRIYQAVNMIATAAAAGESCYLFLFYHSLGSYMAGEWDNMNLTPSAGCGDGSSDQSPPWARTLERSFELANLPSLYQLLERAKEGEGDVTIYACSNSMRYLDLDPADVNRRVDGVVGLATMLDIASDGSPVLYL
jgi:peroxiredoxin family protein